MERPLAKFKNPNELQRWIETKPREVSLVLAARASLRAFPVVQLHGAVKKGSDGELANFVLLLFRVMACPWVAARYPAHEMQLIVASARVAFNAVYIRSNIVTPGRNAQSQFVAALNGALAAINLPNSDYAHAAASAVFLAADSIHSPNTSAALNTSLDTFGPNAGATPISSALVAFWSAFDADVVRVEEGVPLSELARRPLWPQGQPGELRSLWQEMKEALLTTNQNWQVWTDWYDDRLEGRVQKDERELVYVRIEDDLWLQGLAVVNAEIKRRIEELERPPVLGVLLAVEEPDSAAVMAEIEERQHVAQVDASAAPLVSSSHTSESVAESLPPVEAIPQQVPTATTFRTNSEGLIDVVPDPPAPETVADSLQRELYEDIRLKTQELIQLGHNQLGELSNSAHRFLGALKDRIEDLSITTAWSRGNALRSRLRAHDIAIGSREPDPARLPPLVAENLRDLIQTWNVFIIGDPKGRELDEVSLGPAELDAARRQIAAAAPIVEAIKRSENVATTQAIEIVVEQNSEAVRAPAGINGDQAIDLSRRTTGNFVIQLLRGELQFAWKELRAGVYRAAGTAVFNHPSELLSFIGKNADSLKTFGETAWHNPAIAQIIDAIARAFH